MSRAWDRAALDLPKVVCGGGVVSVGLPGICDLILLPYRRIAPHGSRTSDREQIQGLRIPPRYTDLV